MIGVTRSRCHPTGGPCCSATGCSTRPGKWWGDAAAISGYLGSGTAFDQAIARFAGSYAGQVTADYEALAGQPGPAASR